MNRRHPGTTCFRVVVLLLLGSLTAPPAGFPADAQSGRHPGNDEKISFLTLVVTADSVRLDRWTEVTGILKKPRSVRRGTGISYQAVSHSGTTLWQGFVGDPLTRRLEVEDSLGSGRLSTQIVTRLPTALQAERVEFWKSDPSAAVDGKAVGRRLIGTIPWPPSEQR